MFLPRHGGEGVPTHSGMVGVKISKCKEVDAVHTTVQFYSFKRQKMIIMRACTPSGLTMSIHLPLPGEGTLTGFYFSLFAIKLCTHGSLLGES